MRLKDNLGWTKALVEAPRVPTELGSKEYSIEIDSVGGFSFSTRLPLSNRELYLNGNLDSNRS